MMRSETLARVVYAREALEVGDVGLVATILLDLEEDLASALGGSAPTHKSAVHGERSLACPDCSATFYWPGELDHHQRFVHFAEAA